jgi:hypothetical protein
MKRLIVGTLTALAIIIMAFAPAADAGRLGVAGCPIGGSGRCVGGEG